MQKQRKFNPKKKPQSVKTNNNGQVPTWKQVKIDGPVIADEGADFGGFIGLEVLENYSEVFVKKAKRMRENDTDLDDKKKKPKRKRRSSDGDTDSDDSDSGEDRRRKKKRQSKLKQDWDSSDESDFEEPTTSRKQQKQRQETKSAVTESNEEDSGFDDQPKNVVKKPVNDNSASKSAKVNALSELETKPNPGFSMLLKPPKPEQKQSKRKRVSKNSRKASESEPYSSVDYTAWIQLGVSETIVRALADKGFKVPTEIQTQSLPVAIYGRRDLLGAAETGSGKTLAFGIPMLEGIMRMKQKNALAGDDSNEHELTPPPEDLDMTEADEKVFNQGRQFGKRFVDKPLYGLILTPTRELAVQINDHLKAVAKYTDINIATIFGGLAAVKQERLLRKCPEIVIATPGRLWELIQGKNHHLLKVTDISYLVIDETDRMLEKGHFDELKQLLELINANEDAKKRRRNYIFSATLTMDHELPEHLKFNAKKAKKVRKITPGQRMDNLIEIIGMTNPKIVDLTQDHGTARTLTESRILCQAEHKDFFLYYFLQRHPGRTLVFCNSIECVKRLASLFSYLDCAPYSLFGSMQQRQRLKNLERFTSNRQALLIATDVAARGLDIPNVDHVIHYQVPKTTENYVHRSGRTARANKEGLTVLFISPTEVRDYVKLNQDLGRTEDLPMYPTSDRIMRQIKERVVLARNIEKMDLKQRRAGADRSWEDQLAKEFQSDSDIDSEQEQVRKMDQTKQKRLFKAKRMELSRVLATPIVFDRMEMYYPSINAEPMNLTNEKEQSAISLVRKAEQERILEKKQRGKRKKAN